MNRIDLINSLIQKYDFKSYLELGCRHNKTFDAIKLNDKVGIDNNSGGTLRITTDEFFYINRRKFDIIFIDALHIMEQTYRDFVNSAAALTDTGIIILHDCLPEKIEHQTDKRGTWN